MLSLTTSDQSSTGQNTPCPSPAALPEAAGQVAVRLVIVTAVRLFGEGLTHALRLEQRIGVVGAVQHLGAARDLLRTAAVEVVLLDVSVAGLDLDEVKQFAAEWPEVKLLALGLIEQRAEVIRCARAGFSGYINRDTALLDLVPLLAEAARGGARCSVEIAAALMQALHRPEAAMAPLAAAMPSLTPRESEILQLLDRGFSNKEIARDLTLSAATVKNHVHNVLAKLNVARRRDAARCMRDRRWMTGSKL